MDDERGGGSRPSLTRPPPLAPPGDPAIADRIAAIERILRTTSIAAFLMLIAWLLRDILLLGFAALLIACVLRGVAEFLHRHSGVDPNWTLALVVVMLAAFFAGLIWWRGVEIVGQIQQLVDQLTEQVDRLWQQVSNGAWGTRVADGLRHSIESVAIRLPGFATGVVTSTLGIGGSLLVVLVASVCLAASPQIYIIGSLRLLPSEWRGRGHDVLREVGQALRLWCLGQLIDMVVVTLLVGAGLSALGVPLVPTLALFAGLLNFVPYVGALVGAVPAVLVALAQSPTLAMWVAILFLAGTDDRGKFDRPLRPKADWYAAACLDHRVANNSRHIVRSAWPHPCDTFHGCVPRGDTHDLCRNHPGR